NKPRAVPRIRRTVKIDIAITVPWCARQVRAMQDHSLILVSTQVVGAAGRVRLTGRKAAETAALQDAIAHPLQPISGWEECARWPSQSGRGASQFLKANLVAAAAPLGATYL